MNRWDARLDWLRAVALVLILLHHADDYAVQYLRATPGLARFDDVFLAWVPLATFFAISGYLAGASRVTSAGEHVRRRFSRLYVPYAVSLVLLAVLSVFDLGIRDVLLNLLLLGPWAGAAVGTLWFIEVLLYYQLVYAGWLAIGESQRPVWSLPLLFGVATLLFAGASALMGWAPDPRLAAYLPAFTGGACFGLHLSRAEGAGARGTSFLAAAALPPLLMLVPLWEEPAWDTLIWSTITALGVVVALAAWPKPSASPRLVHAVAYGSFMAYLLHRFVFYAAAAIGNAWGDTGVGVTVLLAIPVVLVAGVYGQRLVDRIGRR